MKINTIKLNDIVNSDEGINISVFTQYCPHHCKGCFNKETWPLDGGYEYNDKVYQYIYENINKNGVKRNLSLLGGEPLAAPNIEGVIDLCKRFKNDFPERHIYLWTGYVFEDLSDDQREVLPYIDTMIDGKFVEELKDITLKLRGSKNQRVIDVQESINRNEVILYCK